MIQLNHAQATALVELLSQWHGGSAIAITPTDTLILADLLVRIRKDLELPIP